MRQSSNWPAVVLAGTVMAAVVAALTLVVTLVLVGHF